MPHIFTVLVFVVLVVGAGFIGFSLQTSDTETPQDTQVVVEEGTPETPAEETPKETPEAPPTGVTRDLSNQGITEVTRSEFDRVGTEILLLSGNKLTSLQAEVRLLSNLRSLDLSNNVLTNIPAELGQLSKLEVLNLRNNKLTGLPYELGNLKNLKTLDLRGNDYAEADLAIIKKSLSTATRVLVD